MLNKNFLLGFLGGAFAGVAAYKLYEQNGGQLHNLISGIGSCDLTTSCEVEAPHTGAEPDLAELISQKERLEDLIAEQMAAEK